jgi:hypothetical protein
MQVPEIDPALKQFYRQYRQQVNEPCFPTSKTLLNPYVQDHIYRYMFDQLLPNLPPVSYRKRILKTITERIESVMEDPEEDVCSSFPILTTSIRAFHRSLLNFSLTLRSRRSPMPLWKTWPNCVSKPPSHQLQLPCKNLPFLTTLLSKTRPQS